MFASRFLVLIRSNPHSILVSQPKIEDITQIKSGQQFFLYKQRLNQLIRRINAFRYNNP